MRKKKSISASICESRKIAMPEEINPHGTLFGGVIMSWIDKIGYMCAQNYAESKKTVTVNIDNIQFLKPVFSGDHVALKAIVTSVGKSSMEIEVTLFKEDPVSKKRELVGEAFMTFVSLGPDGKGKVVPELLLENDEDKVKYKKSQLRLAHRTELKQMLKNVDENLLETLEDIKYIPPVGKIRTLMDKKRDLIRNIVKLTHSKHLLLGSSANLSQWKFFRVKS